MKVLVLVAAMVAATAGQEPDETECDCQPIAKCAIAFETIQSACTLEDDSEGVCCPPEQIGASDSGMIILDRSTEPTEPIGDVPQNTLEAASMAGKKAVKDQSSLEKSLIQSRKFVPRGTPASAHLHRFHASPGAKDMDKRALAILAASTNLKNELNLGPRAGLGLRNVLVSSTSLADQCPPVTTCNDPSTKYRSADGSCNNLQNPDYGKSNTALQRHLPPTYDDGVSAFRTLATDGSPLPNVRNISVTLFNDIDMPDRTFTLSVMQWAQFMDHDLALILFPALENGEAIECCDSSVELHPRCQAIDVLSDRFYQSQNVTCMNFVRSMLAVGPGESCTFGYAEQLNQPTHWLDGSTVYGITQEAQYNLRTRENGLLKTSSDNLLPINPDQGGDCEADLSDAECYLAGDSRVNEQPGLTTIHTLWMREHNRVASELQRLHPDWLDEQLFQEARRIVVAEIQHITFNEWLPIILGNGIMHSSGLNVLRRGFSNDYDPTIKPNMNSEFSTAAYRFGHTLVQGILDLFAQDGSVSGTVMLRNHFNSPHLIQNDGRLNDVVRTLVQFPIQSFDNFITSELTNHLYQTPRFDFGMDLMSLNLHRGRDHGIATYNSARELCGRRRARNFKQLRDLIHPRLTQRLESVYRNVDDIDLFAGGLLERPRRGSLLGETFACIVADQFARLKRGDRFFYDLGGQAGSFTEAQLNEIRQASWARIICDNSDISEIQPLAFELDKHNLNRRRSCNSRSIPRVDLSVF